MEYDVYQTNIYFTKKTPKSNSLVKNICMLLQKETTRQRQLGVEYVGTQALFFGTSFTRLMPKSSNSIIPPFSCKKNIS